MVLESFNKMHSNKTLPMLDLKATSTSPSGVWVTFPSICSGTVDKTESRVEHHFSVAKASTHPPQSHNTLRSETEC